MGITKYLHCGKCFEVLNIINPTRPNAEFNTYDCSVKCKCGRLNLSSDGIEERKDSFNNIHYFYVRDDEDEIKLSNITNGFTYKTR